ncbi:thiazolylpeptide-type bacteriocin [Streptacidiphilus albus]|uniref:thiazolylpeptide-type bacteriocin n=1 Tax=Streptacidiphilus albus TaxID=105425 RepID=UPI00054BFE5C|nr:thiazolylpeptide-type bacteriocin [Streptacidiphilus albus]
MSDSTANTGFDLQDLDLSDLAVTSMRDTVALPENAASAGASSCQASSSCSVYAVPEREVTFDRNQQ